jgi:DNA-binding CsgD family transcriptional regulator
MAASGHVGANFGLRKEATASQPRKIPFPSGVEPSLQVLIRKLVALACNGSDACAEDDNGEGQIIIDAEVDGVRCLLTRLEKSPTSRISISFSPRESEIARMVAKGYPNKTIAAVLEISSWTVCTHLRRIFAKLRVSSRAAMVARMMDTGILGRTSERDKQEGNWDKVHESIRLTRS